MCLRHFLVVIGTVLATATSLSAQSPVVIGAGTAEWDERAPIAVDPPTDSGGGTSDLSRLWIESDADYLYLAAEVGAPVLLSDGNDLVLALDADNDASTGRATQGLGAELVWRFGDRSGTLYTASGSRSVEWADIEFWTAPQITSTRFEMALPLEPDTGVLQVVSGPSVRVAITSSRDAIAASADLSAQPRLRQPVVLDKLSASHVRVLAYNVLRDQLFESSSEDSYRRVLKAIRPDVVVFSEIYNASADETVSRLATLLDESADDWYGAKAGNDIIVVARTPVTLLAEVVGNGLFRVQAPGSDGQDWIVAGMHPPCCRNDVGRQNEVDAMVAAIRNFRASGVIPEGAPLVVAGDMNFVGDARQLDTLFGGDIENESRYGSDAPPDTDGSPLTDAAPLATGAPVAFTWRSASSDFPPGQLDYLAYSDAVLSAGRSFILFTPGMTPDERATAGLQLGDAAGREGSGFTSDHLPVVTDLFVTKATAMDAPPIGSQMEILDATPNPAVDLVTLHVSAVVSAAAQIAIYDPLGRRVRQLHTGPLEVGTHSVLLDLAGLASGIYVVRVDTPLGTASRQITVAR